MTRSLLDGANLPLLRSLMGAAAEDAIAAGLVDTGLLQFDPDDAAWDDRDRMVVCGDGVTASVAARIAAAGGAAWEVVTPAATGGDAMALALGAAVAAGLDGAAWRAWCVLDDAACDDGRVWEIARSAASPSSPTFGVLVAGAAGAQLWRACGWAVHEAPAGDPVWLLGALDQLSAGGPAVVMVVTP